MSDGTGIGLEEAIAELATPTGNKDIDAVRLACAENIRKGYMVPSGRDRHGGVMVKLTAEGKQFVRQLGKRKRR